MRWYLETNSDPKLFWDAEFEDGNVSLHSGEVDGETTSETLTFDTDDEAAAELRDRAMPLFAKGYEMRVPPDERYTPHPRIAKFWNEELVAEWQSMGVTPREPGNYADLWRQYLAVAALPEELDQFLDWRASHTFGHCNFGEWRLWDSECWLPEREHGNLFEQLVVSDQQNYLGTAMMEHLASWVFLGTAGNGDSYFAHPNHADPNQAEVIYFNHETHSPDFFIADSLASLAWVNHCYRELSDEEFDQDRFVEDFTLLEERVTLSWHYSDLEETAEIEPVYEANSRGIYYFHRAMWIDYLLRQNGVVDVENVGDFFYPDFHAPLRFEEALQSPFLRTTPITALYWLWRLWWFDKPELEQCLEVVADHPSPVVVDCVALIRELEAGRKTLGKITDIHALRQRFLALDIDPDRAEARALEEIEAARRADAELAEHLERAHAVIATGDVEAVRAALWEFTEQPEVLEVLYECLQYEDPAAKPWINRWRFLDQDGASRDGRFYEFEREEVLEVISRGGALLAPRFAKADDYRGLPLAARTAGDRVKPTLVDALAARDKYGVAVTAAAHGLAALGATEFVPQLVALLGELRWAPDDFVAAIERKDALLAVIDALGTLGGAEARDALIALLEPDFEDIWPRVLVALGRTGDPKAVDTIAGHLGTATSRPAMFALAQIGTSNAREAIDTHLATLAGGVVDLAYEHAMQQLAAQRSGGDVDWALVERLTLVVESKKYEDREHHQALAMLFAEHPDRNRARRMLADYLHHEYREVRDLAMAGLDRLHALPELRWLDRATVDALYDADGIDGLRAALTDPDAIFRHNAARKAVDEGVAAELSDEICALTELYCRFTDYTNGYVQDSHARTQYLIEALARVGSEDSHRLLCRLWKGSNAMYAQVDVLKYDRDGIHARLEPFANEVAAELTTSSAATVQVEAARAFSKASWLFGGCVNGVEWAPDGTRLAVGGEGGVKLFDKKGQCVLTFADPAGAWVYDVTFNHDGSLLAAGAHGGHLWLLDPATGAQVGKLVGHAGVPSGVRKLRFSASGAQLASVSEDQTMRVWDVASRTCTAVWSDPADVNAVDWIDEQTLVIGTDRAVRLISTDVVELDNKSCSGVADVRVNHARKRIYVGTAAKKLQVYTLDLQAKPKEHLTCAAVSRVRCRERELVLTVWEGDEMGVSIATYAGKSRLLDAHHAPCFALDLHPKSGEISAGGRPGIVARWTADGHPLASDGVFHTDEIASIRFCGDEVVTASDDGTAIRWTAAGKAIAQYQSPESRLCDAVMDGKHVFVTGTDFAGCFTLDGELVWRAKPARSEHLALTRDALVVASYNALWWLDRRTGAVLHQSEPFAKSFIFRWARLDDQRLAVAGYDDQKLFIWDLDKRELIDTWELPSSEKGGICGLTEAGGRVFVSRWDKTIVTLDAQTGAVRKRAALPGTRYPIGVDADHTRLFATEGGRVEVYDPETFEQISVIDVGSGLEELAVAPDGQPFFGAKSGEIFTV